jgi:hypothetical protein
MSSAPWNAGSLHGAFDIRLQPTAAPLRVHGATGSPINYIAPL